MSEEPVEAMKAETALGAPVMRENVINLIGDNLATVRYLDGSFVISEGQPYTPVECIFESNVKGLVSWKVQVGAGRHKTAPVADAFIRDAGGGSHMFCVGAISDKSPRELNFAYGIEVELKIGTETGTVRLYFGQGSTLSLVNWWVGSPMLVRPTGGQYWQIPVNVGGAPRLFNFLTINGNTFQFTLQ